MNITCREMENQIDHILVSGQMRPSVLDTRTMKGADVGSDHSLVKIRMRLELKKVTQKNKSGRDMILRN